MNIKIYTMPHCDKCKEIKEYLSGMGIEEVDLGEAEGVAEIRKIYPKIKDKITRKDGQLPIPLVIIGEKVAHTLIEVKEALK